MSEEKVMTTEIVAPEDVVKADEVTPAIFEQTDAVMFSTIQANDRESQVKLFNAINASENALADHVGEVIEVKDMVAHVIELEDEQTNEKVKALRVVLVTPDGAGYHAVSQGVVSALTKIINVVGQGPWTPPLKVVPVEVKTRKGYRTLTIRLQG